jgi:hypothetical protein
MGTYACSAGVSPKLTQIVAGRGPADPAKPVTVVVPGPRPAIEFRAVADY